MSEVLAQLEKGSSGVTTSGDIISYSTTALYGNGSLYLPSCRWAVINCIDKTTLNTPIRDNIYGVKRDGTISVNLAGQSTVDVTDYDYVVVSSGNTFTGTITIT